jgi:hypothetical protein
MNPGDVIVWYEQRKWGGKQAVPAVFLGFVGHKQTHARISVNGGCKTVKIDNIRPQETP